MGKPYRCSLNNEQILSSCMRSIPLLKQQEGPVVAETRKKKANDSKVVGREMKSEVGRKGMDKGAIVAFIGTHRDLEATCTETQAERKKA